MGWLVKTVHPVFASSRFTNVMIFLGTSQFIAVVVLFLYCESFFVFPFHRIKVSCLFYSSTNQLRNLTSKYHSIGTALFLQSVRLHRSWLRLHLGQNGGPFAGPMCIEAPLHVLPILTAHIGHVSIANVKPASSYLFANQLLQLVMVACKSYSSKDCCFTFAVLKRFTILLCKAKTTAYAFITLWSRNGHILVSQPPP